MKDTTAHSVIFQDLFDKPLKAEFDQPDCSSDGGAILLKACDQNLGLMDAISNCLRDDRQQGKVSHTIRDLVQQRVFGIACGYEYEVMWTLILKKNVKRLGKSGTETIKKQHLSYLDIYRYVVYIMIYTKDEL